MLRISGDVESAIKELRQDGNPVDFVGICFGDENSTELKLLGKGTGGIEAFRDLCIANDVCYGVIKKIYAYDSVSGGGSANVTKFIRVCWRPESKIPLKRKMKIGPLDSQIKKVLGSTHSDIETDNLDELTEKALVELIERITQKADKVASAEGKTASTMYNSGSAVKARSASTDNQAALKKHDAYHDGKSLIGTGKGADVDFENIDQLKASLQRVRDDSSDITWSLMGYKDKKTISFIAEGKGDVSELISSCKPAVNCFGLFRVIEQIDKTTAVKFCLLSWQPEDVPTMQRAAQSTHRGGILPIFRPYHADFTIGAANELDHERVMDHIMSLSGTKSKVTLKQVTGQNNKSFSTPEKVSSPKFLGGVTKDASQTGIDCPEKDEISKIIKAIRNDKDTTSWIVCYLENNPGSQKCSLILKNKGQGDVEEFADCLCDDDKTTAYGFVRHQVQIDRTMAIKFTLVTFSGKNMPIPLKSKISVSRGSTLPIFQPFHLEMLIDSRDEINSEILTKKLSSS